MSRTANLFTLTVQGNGATGIFDRCEYLQHVHATDGLELRFGRMDVNGSRLPEQRIPATRWTRYELVKLP